MGVLLIRKTQQEDLNEILILAQNRRLEYQTYQPVFWRVASDAVEQQERFLRDEIDNPNVIAFSALTQNKLVGFLIGRLVPAPPIYNPGGLTFSIDDFVVERPEMWHTAGYELLVEAKAAALSRDAAQIVVVCGHLDQAKRELLKNMSLSIASEWWVSPLGSD